jgi:hypothetical protein
VKGRAPVLAYSNVFGEGGLNGTGLYYLASAADKVFMPPTGCLSLLGFESTQVRSARRQASQHAWQRTAPFIARHASVTEGGIVARTRDSRSASA